MIKKIRSNLNRNQTEFAELLNITFATVNRWENGRAVPNKLAQSKMYELCKEYNIPVYDMVMEKIRLASQSIELEDGKVLLYHGSTSGIEGNITDAALINSLSALEFGKQYVAITQKGCDAIKIECEVELSYLERQFLKEVAESNRMKGISLANKICKNLYDFRNC